MAAAEDSRVHALTRAGVAAALSVAREQGLPAEDPRVLSSRGNLLVHLAPAPVVARVATLTAWTRRDPFAWLAREVAVASYLAHQGAAAVPPTSLADPGPHRQDGLTLSLWTYVQPATERAGPAIVGAALGRLHLALDGFPGELPWMAPVHAQIDDGLAALERDHVLDRAELLALRARHAEILADLDGLADETIVLHGDAHGGNLLSTAGGWLWADLEETCRGPREWDLAVLVHSAESAAKGSTAKGSTGQDSAGQDSAAQANASQGSAGPGNVGQDSAAQGNAGQSNAARNPAGQDSAGQDSAGQVALAAYAAVTGTPPPAREALIPYARARELEGAVWSLGMAHQYPSRYQSVARDLLASVLRAAR